MRVNVLYKALQALLCSGRSCSQSAVVIISSGLFLGTFCEKSAGTGRAKVEEEAEEEGYIFVPF